MLTSLPLVSDLHHSAMRERHWQQLMKVSPLACRQAGWLLYVATGLQATGKNFVMDNKFNLGNLLKLELHNYVDACR